MRSRSGVVSKKRHKKVLDQAKGYRGTRKNLYRHALRVVRRGLVFAYRDRRNKKRDFRKLWIQRISAASRMLGTTYSVLMNKISSQNVILNRKVLSDIAAQDFETFKKILEDLKV